MGKTTLPVTAFDRHRGSGCPLTPATVGHLVIDTTGAGIPKKLLYLDDNVPFCPR